jgi:hypothetical protein
MIASINAIATGISTFQPRYNVAVAKTIATIGTAAQMEARPSSAPISREMVGAWGCEPVGGTAGLSASDIIAGGTLFP